jgi:hypothetical protein
MRARAREHRKDRHPGADMTAAQRDLLWQLVETYSVIT